jgi:hypothetical protein
MLSKLSNNPLYQLYYDFFIHQSGGGESADNFATEMQNLFTTVGNHNITTICMNLKDGIGDYVSQVYFIDKLNKISESIPNINMRNLSLISKQKLGIAKIIRNEMISEDTVLILDSSKTGTEDKVNIVGIPNKIQKIELDKILNESDFIFNIALPLEASNDDVLSIAKSLNLDYKPCTFEIDTKRLKQDVMTASWLQYGFLNQNWRKEPKKIAPSYNGPLFSQAAMGLHADQRGIRFIDTISSAVKKNKSLLLQDLNKDKFKIPYEDTKIAEYIEKNAFAVGYLQHHQASRGFIKLACQTSLKSGDMNALVNTDDFKSVQSDNDFIQALITAGFTHIELPESNLYFTLSHSDQEKSRTLRLFNFKGVSEKDKTNFYGLAEFIAASGDTSVSELISSGLVNDEDSAALPFFQPFLTGPGPLDSILRELPFAFQSAETISPKANVIYLDRDSYKLTYKIVNSEGKILQQACITDDELLQDIPGCCALLFNNDTLPKVLDLISKKESINLEQYTARSMEELKVKAKTIYIESTNEGLNYKVKERTYPYLEVEKNLLWEELPQDFPRSISEIMASRNTCFPILLNILAKKGHIPEVDLIQEKGNPDFEKLIAFLALERKILT